MSAITPAAIVRPAARAMSKDEARRAVERIKSHFADARSALLELYDRAGWKALGYGSWRRCVLAEFDLSHRRIYQLLTAARIEIDVTAPIDEQACVPEVHRPQIPEKVLRPLAPLAPQERRSVYRVAVASSGGAVPTAARVAWLVRKARGGAPPGELEEMVRQEERRQLREDADAGAREAADDRRLDVERMQARTRQARRIAERLGLTECAAALRRAEAAMKGAV